MGRHTTPGVSTSGPRDEVIGWGAFSTCIAAVLVGVLAGRFEGLGVLVLGALTTGALWLARNHTEVGLGRGRHASDTPWSPSDLLELKDAEPAGDGARRTEQPARRRVVAGPQGVGESRAGRGRAPAGRTPAPEQEAGPLGWLPGATVPEPVDAEHGWTAVPSQAMHPRAWGTPPALPVPADGTPPVGLGPFAVHGVAGGPLSAAPGRSSGRRSAGPPDAVAPAASAATPVAAVAPDVPVGEDAAPSVPTPEPMLVRTHAGTGAADGPPPRVPGSRRARRVAEATGGPTPPVLPVAPFGVGTPLTAEPQPAPVERVALTPLQRVPSQPTPPDPLAGPMSPDLLAAEPAVLDPALDVLRVARVLERESPGPARRAGSDRERAAAAIDPLWARRARRPERPRGPQVRPAALRREPAPVARAEPQWQPVHLDHGWRSADADVRWQQPDPRQPDPRQREEPLAEEPALVALPDPDVPDVLLLPETGGAIVGPADGSAVDAVVLPDDPALGPGPGVPASRPAPGTLSLDELLVLHTRRPAGRRTGSGDQPGDSVDRRLE